MFPAITTSNRITLHHLLEQSEGKPGKFADLYNYRYQLEINQKLMDLTHPNIPDEDRELLDTIIKAPNNGYDPVKFVKLYNEDLMGKTLLSPQIWLSETFAKLTQYELKDQE